MTRPRKIDAGNTSMITRVCSERRAFLRPTRDGEVNAVHGYSLALAVRDTGVECHAYVAMANHTHDLITDVLGQRPLFCQQLHSNVARVMNVRLRRDGPLWEPGHSYNNVDLADAAAVLRKIVYVITNPVRAGLVTRIEDYPGFVTRPEEIGIPLTFVRPAEFFRAPGDDAAEDRSGGPRTARDRARHHARVEEGPRDPLPDQLTLTFTKPPQFADMSLPEFRRLVREAVDEETARIAAERRAAGARRVVGRAALFALDTRKRPPGDDEDHDRDADEAEGDGEGEDRAGRRRRRSNLDPGALRPGFAASGRSRAKRVADAQQAFWKAHARARRAFREGDRRVLFPQGTWAAVQVFGLATEDFDP